MAQRSRKPVTAATEAAGTGTASVGGASGRYNGNRVGAALLLVVAAPLITLLALMTRLTSPGSALFRQVRLGRNGRRFVILKLRTMVEGAESMHPDSWTRANDPRVTPLGTLLRRWHLDELPQLVNVIRGEMALVGPRPERPEIAANLRRLIPDYDRRLEVLPGIVGLAQINLPPDSGVDSVRKKLLLDLEYIGTATLGLDLRMLAWSLLRLMGVPFSLATRGLGLERSVDGAALGADTADSSGPADRLEPPSRQTDAA